MFGRKKSDDYDEYNESINAKYDDDYIRESREYREECSHSHEQTYENYDVHSEYKELREECDHSHEQTYEDCNSEQKPYDEQNKLETFFESQLHEGEYILWCGEPEKGANSSETGMGCASGGLNGMVILAVVLLLLFPPLGIILIICTAVTKSAANIKGRKYAITNHRIIVGGSMSASLPLSSVGAINFHSSSRNIGYVVFQIKPQYVQQSPSRVYTRSNGIFAVKDPGRVADILKQAKQSYLNYQGSVNNG